MRQSRTLGSVGGGAQQCPRLPGHLACVTNSAISIVRRQGWFLPEANRRWETLDLIPEVVVRQVIATTGRPCGKPRHAIAVPGDRPIPQHRKPTAL